MKRTLLLCLICIAHFSLANPARAAAPAEITATYPLEPLSALEMKAAYEIVMDHFKAHFKAQSESAGDLPDPNPVHEGDPPVLRFPMMVLSEPPKQTVLDWKTGVTFPRVAHVEILHNESNRTWVALVDLRKSELLSLEQMPEGTQPAMTYSEILKGIESVRNNERWRQAITDRKLDAELVYLDPWVPGDATLPDEVAARLSHGQNTRLFRYLSFNRGAKLENFDPVTPQNPYDRPVEGNVVTVDMNANPPAVVDVTKTVVHPVSTESGNSPATVALKTLISEQPQDSDIELLGTGPGCKREERRPRKPGMSEQSEVCTGALVRWHNWQFYVALHPREGLVLYDVRFADRGSLRPIAYRMSLSEIYASYGLGDENWAWRSALEVGEYNAGSLAQTLEVNRDFPENALLLDEVYFNDTGPDEGEETGKIEIPAAVALYERDAGILWSRTEPEAVGEEEKLWRDTRYARELVVTWNCWIGNYIYGFDWIFKLDGSIETRALLTGTTLNRGLKVNAATEASAPKVGIDNNGVFVAAPLHQHFFSFRLDLDVDGPINDLMEMEVAHLPDPGFKNSFAPTMQHIEQEGFRDANPFTLRHWHVEGSSKNAFGKPTSYALEPGGFTVPYSAPDFPGLARAAFAQHQLWLTQYQQGELYAAGAFPYQGPAGAGLPEFVRDAANLVKQDVVIWYTGGYTHVTRPEDFPVMPAETIGFRLVPRGFFTRNPALDVADQSR